MKKIIRLTGVIAFTVLFDILFWHESMGLNTLLFTLLVFGFIYFQNKASFRNIRVLITFFATLLSAVFVVYHNSATSKFAFICSFIVTMGFVFEPQLRSVLPAWTAGFLNYFVAPASWIRDLNTGGDSSKPKRNLFRRWVGYTLLPLMVFIIFIFIYKGANPKFSSYVNNVWSDITTFFEELFVNFSWAQFFFILFGLSISVWLIYKSKVTGILQSETTKKNNLERQDIKANHYKGRFKKSTALKKEYIQGTILLFLINSLILIVNIIDITWIWFDFKLIEGMDLKQLVHEGTYLLILAVLLSMVIILYFFRGNLNFYKKKKLLLYLTYLWLLQNLIMVVSVAMRNLHYIHYYGLAYKRIGVMVFLLLTIVGIITIFYKIHKLKTGYFLLKTNTWSVYLVMILLPIVNWDIFITKHNMNHPMPENMEADFLLRMSDETLYYLYENKEQFADKPFLKNYHSQLILKYRIAHFIVNKKDKSWLSYSFDEDRSYRKLNQMLNLNKNFGHENQ